MSISIHFTVIANSGDHVDALLNSALESGFSESMFTILWNDSSNTHEPYSTIRRMLDQSTVDFEVLCHQDIRFLPAYGYSVLSEMLMSITGNVSIYGIAGVTEDCRWYCLADDDTIWPEGDVSFDDVKFGVTHVDECFICFSTRNKTSTSSELSGFHCYGTDVTLRALDKGFQTVLIPYKVIHLSTGNFGDDFHSSLETFCSLWSTRVFGFTQRGGYCVIAPQDWCRKLLIRKKVQKLFILFWGKSLIFLPDLMRVMLTKFRQK